MHTGGNGQRVTVCCVTDFHEGIFARGGTARTEDGGMGVTTGKICVLGPLLKLEA